MQRRLVMNDVVFDLETEEEEMLQQFIEMDKETYRESGRQLEVLIRMHKEAKKWRDGKKLSN